MGHLVCEGACGPPVVALQFVSVSLRASCPTAAPVHPLRAAGKASHVQQTGRGHPTPSLLANRDASREVAWPQLAAHLTQVPGVDAEAATRQLEGGARAVMQTFWRHVAATRGEEAHGW